MNPLLGTRLLLGWLVMGAAATALAVVRPAWGGEVVAATQLGGALLAAVVLARRGQLGTRLGAGVVSVLALAGTSSTLLVAVGPGNAVSLGFIVASQLVGLALITPVVAQHQRSGPRESRPMVLAEVATVAVGLAVAVAQSTLAALRVGAGAPAATAAAWDVVALGVIGWLWLTRRGTRPAAVLVLAGCALLVSWNYTAAVRGVELGSPADPMQLLAVLGGVLLTAAGLHPGVTEVGRAERVPVMRSGAVRLVVALPLSLAPVLAWVVGLAVPHAALPAPVLIGAGAALTLLGLVRALGLVADAERRADTDVLTGGLGRRGGLRRLDALHAEGRPTWVGLLDIDDFTEVNRHHGQDVGDALLRAVLDRLVQRMPRGSVVARLGGDEVLLLVPDLQGTTGDTVAAAAAAAVDTPLVVRGSALALTVSVGVADLLGPGTSREALACADLAMRAAKARGGGAGLRYTAELREEVLGPLLLQRELRTLLGDGGGAGTGGSGAGADGAGLCPEGLDVGERAGSADGAGRLVVHYQPVVDLVTGLADGAEALVRWEHPERGLVPPGDFLPLVEAAGLGAALDRVVLHQALHQLAAWDALGVDVARMGVNLGRDSMRGPGLCASVLAACAEAGVGPERLALEITEHDELESDAAVVADLLALREAGAFVALDDFGAGHASVGYLRRWPANIVKLDRSLLPSVAPAQPHPAMLDPLDLVLAVGSFVTALGRRLLVEGIEDEADLDVARRAGAHFAQGYHLARPMTSEALVAWWRARHRGVVATSPAAASVDAAR